MNIWESYDFSNKVTAYSLLISQNDLLKEKTNGLLVQSIEQSLDEIRFYIVSPNLSNFRNLLFNIKLSKEYSFPVDIHSVCDDYQELQVTEELFLEKIGELLSRQHVLGVINFAYSKAYSQLTDN